MPTIEFHRAPLNVRYAKAGQTSLASFLQMPSALRRTAQWFLPESEAAPDKGVTSAEFYDRQQAIVLRHPKSTRPSVLPDITRQCRVGMSHSNSPLPVEIAQRLPFGNTVCALILANDMPERLLVVPFESLDKTLADIAPPQLADSLREAREQAYSHETCKAIGQTMTHEIFVAAFAHALPAENT